MSRPTPDARLRGGSIVAVGMVVMNVAVYAFLLIAARSLEPNDFGALTALLGIILVGNVCALGLQASTARRLAVHPERSDAIVALTTRVTVLTASVVGLLVAASSVIVSPLLQIDSVWPVILCGATLIPLTIMGAQCGIAQGTARWRWITAIYLANGFGRMAVGGAALLVSPTLLGAMIGVALGAWLPVLVGSPLMRIGRGAAEDVRRRDLLREVLLGTHALGAYFLLSNLDALLARNLFDGHTSGTYAAGLILTKAALFLPQFVSVVFYPALARARGRGPKIRAVGLVGAFGLLAVGATAVLPQVALIFIGGEKYEDIVDRLWLFALSGAILAIVHLLVFDALARHAHGVVVLVWLAVAAVVGVAYGVGVGVTGLVSTMVGVGAVLAVTIWFAPGRSTHTA